MKKKCLVIIFLLLTFSIDLLPLTAQEVREEIKQEIPISGNISYNIQKYSGFNFFITSLVKTLVKTLVKLKTHANDINCKIEIFSGLDLLKRKLKSFSLDVKDLTVKNIPIEYFEVTTSDPIYFKRNLKKRYRIIYPASIATKVIINPTSVIEIIDSMSNSNKQGKEVELPLPPLGSTKVLLKDLMIQVNESGFVQSAINAVSIINPDSEPLIAMFSGNLVIEDKKLLVSNLECEIEDIFTKDSDVSMAFCEAIGDLINPVVNFHKYEKRGITIDNVDLSFPKNKLLLKINLMLMPEGTNVKN